MISDGDCKQVFGCILFPIFMALCLISSFLSSLGGAEVIVPALIVGVVIFVIWWICSQGNNKKAEPEEKPKDEREDRTIEMR